VLPPGELVAAIAATEAPLQEWLAIATPQQLNDVRDGQSRTFIEEIAFLVWHETTHVGQMEQFRRLAGYTDKVIWQR
jgi:hypothetical protein